MAGSRAGGRAGPAPPPGRGRIRLGLVREVVPRWKDPQFPRRAARGPRSDPRGVLVVGRRQPGPFPGHDVKFLQLVAGHLNTALERSQRYEAERAHAERVSDQKTDLLRMAGHDLKTPLSAIQLQIDLLKAEGASSETQRSLGLLERNTRRMARLLDNLLDLARLESDRLVLAPQPFDLGRAIRSTVETFEDYARRAGLRIVVAEAEAVTVDADSERVSQVLSNLVGNALKFTPAGGRGPGEVPPLGRPCFGRGG